MIDKKPFSSLAWDVSEKEYRADSALSYSTLAKYEREGFEHLDTLFDKVESPSLLLGSCVDTLLTDGEEAFNEAYYVSDIPSMEPTVEPVVKEVFNRFKNAYTDINAIPDDAKWIIPVSLLMNMAVFFFLWFVVYIASSKKRIEFFSKTVAKILNSVVKTVSFGRKRQLMRYEKISNYFAYI